MGIRKKIYSEKSKGIFAVKTLSNYHLFAFYELTIIFTLNKWCLRFTATSPSLQTFKLYYFVNREETRPLDLGPKIVFKQRFVRRGGLPIIMRRIHRLNLNKYPELNSGMH